MTQGLLSAGQVERDARLEVYATYGHERLTRTARLQVIILDVPETCTLRVSTSPADSPTSGSIAAKRSPRSL